MITAEERLNELCAEVAGQVGARPDDLNLLHACRKGHPLGFDNPWKWRNAASLVTYRLRNSPHAAWIKAKARKEALA